MVLASYRQINGRESSPNGKREARDMNLAQMEVDGLPSNCGNVALVGPSAGVFELVNSGWALSVLDTSATSNQLVRTMGFRFRKSIPIIPGFRINLGKRSASLSVGGKGLTTNISAKGVRNTISLPGTGLSYSTYQKNVQPVGTAARSFKKVFIWAIVIAVIVVFVRLL